MRIHIGTDHAGLEFSRVLREHLVSGGHEVLDHGPQSFDPEDDYPLFCISAALGVVADNRVGVEALGIVLGGSGNGEQIAANKVDGIRAALVWNDDTALLARQHNDANVISIGARLLPEAEVLRLVDMFIAEPFSGAPRHVRRIAELTEFEAHGTVAGIRLTGNESRHIHPSPGTAGPTPPAELPNRPASTN